MTLLGYHFGGLGVHHVFQQKQLLIEMPEGLLHGPSVFSAEGEGPCNSYGSQGIEPVCILYDPALYRGRTPAFVL